MFGKQAIGILALCILPAVSQGQGPTEADLRKQKLATAKGTYEILTKLQLEGKIGTEPLCKWSERWLDSEGTGQPDIAALEAHIKRLQAVEKVAEAQFKAGSILVTDVNTAIFYRLDAQIRLEQAKSRKKD